MPTRGVTIAEIASAAGVSVPTVSKVLNDRGGVSPATREQIKQLLEAHGYARRGRLRPSSGLIDFVISDLDTQWATALLRGAQAEAARMGKDLVVTTTHGKPVGTPDWVEHLAARGSDGVVKSVRPAHTRYDGDVVFAVAAPGVAGAAAPNLDVLGYLATEAVAAAVRDAVGG